MSRSIAQLTSTAQVYLQMDVAATKTIVRSTWRNKREAFMSRSIANIVKQRENSENNLKVNFRMK